MKKMNYTLGVLALSCTLAACGGQKKADNQVAEETATTATAPTTTMLSYSKSLKAPETDSLAFPIDKDGYITIFDGKTFNGWRGYGKDRVPSRWVIEDGCIKFNGSGGGEAQNNDGGDLIFGHKFKNFEWR